MKCPVCGKENIESNLYCYSCGARLSGKPPGSDKKKTLQLLLIAVLMGILLVECCLFIINPRPDPGAGPDQEPVAETASTADTEPKPKPEPKPVRPNSLPDQYYYHNGHTYGFYNAADLGYDTYDKVSEFCHNQGGHLAVINGPEENEYLFNLVRDNYNKTVFFGYTDKDEEGKWVWDGEGSGYTNWTTTGDWNLPDNGARWGGGEWAQGGEDYAEFNYDGKNGQGGSPNDSTWNDAKFMENTKVFICEWEFDMNDAVYAGSDGNENSAEASAAVPETEEKEKVTPSDENIPADAVAFGGHSYYIFDNICGSWEEAEEYCKSRGGYLAVIDHPEENDFLYEYMLTAGYDEVFFGFTDRVEEGTWVWVSGHESDFEDWGINEEGSQEPNSSNDYEDYAHMNSSMHDGHWNDKMFGQKTVSFFCEWDYQTKNSR